MEFLVFGLNHRTAPLEVRERWAVSSNDAPTLLKGLRGRLEKSEHLVLSTCNRTEFYCSVPMGSAPFRTGGSGHIASAATNGQKLIENARRGALDFYRSARQLARDDNTATPDPGCFYLYRQEVALEHLFRLAGGLDSMILGETQILKQLKDAFAIAQQAESAGRFFHRVFPAALRVGKLVRTTTSITDGCITPGQAALALARQVLRDLRGHKLAVVGSGKIARLALQAADAESLECHVLNRTFANANELVCEVGAGTARDWTQLREVLADVDIIVSTTGSVEPIMTRVQLEAIQRQRHGRQLVVVDLAIPRDFEPEAATVPGVTLFNLDDLNEVIQENVERRHQEIPHAERIIRDELSSFQGSMIYMQVDPVLKHLVHRFEQIRLGVLQSHLDHFPSDLHGKVDQLTNALMKKLLHFPIEKLKSLRNIRDLDEAEVRFLQRLFLTDPPAPSFRASDSRQDPPDFPSDGPAEDRPRR